MGTPLSLSNKDLSHWAEWGQSTLGLRDYLATWTELRSLSQKQKAGKCRFFL